MSPHGTTAFVQASNIAYIRSTTQEWFTLIESEPCLSLEALTDKVEGGVMPDNSSMPLNSTLGSDVRPNTLETSGKQAARHTRYRPCS